MRLVRQRLAGVLALSTNSCRRIDTPGGAEMPIRTWLRSILTIVIETSDPINTCCEIFRLRTSISSSWRAWGDLKSHDSAITTGSTQSQNPDPDRGDLKSHDSPMTPLLSVVSNLSQSRRHDFGL